MKNVTKERSGVRPSDQDAMEKSNSHLSTFYGTKLKLHLNHNFRPVYQNLHTTSNYKYVTNSKNTQISSFYEKNQNLKKCGCFFCLAV
jgi:hypothetical protein